MTGLPEFIKQAASVTSQYKLLAYAIAGLVLLVSIGGREKLRKSPLLLALIIIAIVVLAVSPTIAQILLPKDNLYHITVTVVKANGTQVPAAQVSTDIPSGKVTNSGATQVEVTSDHLPANRIITITAKDATGSLTGSKQITLGADRNPTIQITVERKGTILRGNIYGSTGNPLGGAKVAIEGGPSDERATTDDLGAFEIKTHMAEGEPITVVATAGKRTIRQQHIAGDEPMVIRFEKK